LLSAVVRSPSCPIEALRVDRPNREFRVAEPTSAGPPFQVDTVSSATGAFTDDEPRFLPPAAFTLTPDSKALAAVYSTSATGRLIAKHLIGFIS
jgi:hypothetical protein